MAQTKELQKLADIEKDLVDSLNMASQTLSELSRDKPNNKNVENYAFSFLNKLEKVEIDLTQQIAYLQRASTGQSHEGSSYGCQKDLKMAQFRLEHAKRRLGELEAIANNTS